MVKDKKWVCPFCGSTELKVKTGYVKSTGFSQDDFEEETRFCCSAQSRNAKYAEAAFDPDTEVDMDKISKL